MGFPDPVGVVMLGGFVINSLGNTSSIGVGDVFFQELDSVSKTNLIAGMTYGDFDVNILQPVGSPIIDPDLIDTPIPMMQNALGLED